MTSHRYACTRAELLSLIGGPLAALFVFAASLHAGAWLGLLPAPQRPLDMDQTILLHQAEASRTGSGAEIVLLGDSSCLMDISAKRLGELLPPGHRVLNLGTLSYLDAGLFAKLAERYAAANPDQVRTVLLMVHPEMLRRQTTAGSHVASLEASFQGADFRDLDTWTGRVSFLLALEIVRGRILSRIVPVPLPANYGLYYGFTSDLRRYMSRHHGSAVDPRRYVHRAGGDRVDYELAPHWREASLTFRSRLPANVRFVVAIAPIPRSHAPAGFSGVYQTMLAEWGGWLRADGTLGSLPATLPDGLFASTTHLNEIGARHFTRLLASALVPFLP